MKYFSRAEAEAMIPELERIFEAVADLAAQAELKAQSLRRREREGGDAPADAAIERGQVQFLAHGINDWLKKIVDMGAVPKGVDPALVDFPSRLEGRDIFFCWRLGETKITHYHGVEDGYSGRKTLPRGS